MRTIRITPQNLKTAQDALSKLPCDGSMEIVIREYKKQRRLEANNYYWLRLGEIADQAKVLGQKYSAESWHELLKQRLLPETEQEGITLAGYVKWVDVPNGGRSLVGSTSKLTVRGFNEYVMQVEAFSVTELNVKFTSDREEF